MFKMIDKKIKIDVLDHNNLSDLSFFCKQCNALGYKNNSSLKEIRWDSTKSCGEFWGAWHNKKLISIAGAHPLPEISSNSIRVLFRGCQLFSPYTALSPSHMNSVPFRDILPYQIEKYADKDLYITTNIHKDNSGKMHRTHKVMQLLSKKGIVDLYIDDMILYNTNQSVWKLNKDKYFEIRNRL